MSDVHDRYRMSFDAAAEAYEAARPPYADAAVEWVAERLPLGRVLDLAAGTGKLTRQLVALGADVVAVEPGEGMRAVFARAVPGVEVLAGAAEEIPLPDASVDAVTVGQAFHWFMPEEALREMHRVLRPGGGFALLWNVWDEQDPVLHAVSELQAPLRPAAAGRSRSWHETDDPGLFGPRAERTFRHTRTMSADAIVAWTASTSAVLEASEADRERVLAGTRAIVGAGPVDVSIGTEVVVADRR